MNAIKAPLPSPPLTAVLFQWLPHNLGPTSTAISEKTWKDLPLSLKKIPKWAITNHRPIVTATEHHWFEKQLLLSISVAVVAVVAVDVVLLLLLLLLLLLMLLLLLLLLLFSVWQCWVPTDNLVVTNTSHMFTIRKSLLLTECSIAKHFPKRKCSVLL